MRCRRSPVRCLSRLALTVVFHPLRYPDDCRSPSFRRLRPLSPSLRPGSPQPYAPATNYGRTSKFRPERLAVAGTSFAARHCQPKPPRSLPPLRWGSMMKRMSFSETIFLFFLALVIFGPKKLPEIARQAGKLLNEFRRASNEFKSQIEQEIAHIEVEEQKKKILPPTAAPEGTAGRSLKPGTDAPATLAATAEAPTAELKPVEPATEALPSEAVTASAAVPPPNPSTQESHA